MSAPYHLPHDSSEHARLEEQSAALHELMHNTTFHALPNLSTNNPASKILDIGCGTGTTTISLARHYPTSATTVYGIDLFPVPLHLHAAPLPGNVTFIQADIRALVSQEHSSKGDETFHVGTFDYTFSRLLICGMHDWPAYIASLFSLLKPGGWAEHHDLAHRWYDGTGKRIDEGWGWMEALRQSAERRGMDFDCGKKVAEWMKEVGFVDVRVWEYRWGFDGDGGQHGAEKGKEGRRLERLTASVIPGLFEGLIGRMLEESGGRSGDGRVYSCEEVEGYRREARMCLQPEVGKYQVFYVTVGRKP